MIKHADRCDDRLLAEELDYMRTNPHENELLAIFNLARIDYGRIEYSLYNGRIQVWEINTNPSVLSADSLKIKQRHAVAESFATPFRNALIALDSGFNANPERNG